MLVSQNVNFIDPIQSLNPKAWTKTMIPTC